MFKAGILKYAVIGIGRMGTIHAHNLYKGRVASSKLVAVCDISSDALASFAKKHPTVKCYSSHEELLDNCNFDVVIIAVPHYQHLKIAESFIIAGKNVIIEKPITVELKDALAFCELRKKYPKSRVAIVYNQRTNSVYMRAKALIESGKLGEIRRASYIITNWYRSDAYYANNSWRASYCGEGGGILLNQCVHQLDILTHLLGMPINIDSRISTVNRHITTENDVTAIMEYKNGAFCTLSASGHEQYGTCRLEIAGDKGRIVAHNYKMTFYAYAKSEPELNSETIKGYGSVKKKIKHYRYGYIRLLKDSLYGQQMRIIDNFTKHILKGENLIADSEEGLKALEIINGIYLSAWCSEKIVVPIDNDLYSRMLEDKREIEKNSFAER
ncbi:MAG: Gfo/Idh/MocA family oxidoreductase [Christensenellaceae bacterium]|jgi:predicted dehydrogenase|nr:Gfo/Idh/MocA family oxidoreductase [Christensenellaceae bacterium]